MVRKIGNVLGIVALVIAASPLLAMAQEAAAPVRMTQSPLSVGGGARGRRSEMSINTSFSMNAA